jgi:c-di-GMP-related signal transduction protein
MDIYVARQPIFDRGKNVFAYELLFRAGLNNCYDGRDPDEASLSVIRNLFLLMGTKKLTAGKKAFINFTRNLLLNDTAFYLPREAMVVEILENVEPDDAVLSACHRLGRSGYWLALDDFVLDKPALAPLVELAEFIKIDFRSCGAGEQREAVERLKSDSVHLLAEKVETQEEFDSAFEMGYAYFQGYFFCKPVIVSSKEIPGYKLNYLHMMQEINRRDLEFGGLERIIRRDTSLCYKLLQYINSAFFSLRQPVMSISHALVLLGEREVRKWASLVALTGLAQDRPKELMISSLMRAKFCEALAGQWGCETNEAFLMGMFSTLDVLIGRPLAEILEEMPISEQVKQALLGGANRYRELLDILFCYERGDWENVVTRSRASSVRPERVTEVYLESLQWAEDMLWFQAR